MITVAYPYSTQQDEDIVNYGDGSVIFYTDDYHIYNGIEEHEG